ncbi:hypothetical protein DEA98_08310 [Brucella pseudogrignonensis]|nr:hypothetical protein [Brucella pseudogrignonensis]
MLRRNKDILNCFGQMTHKTQIPKASDDLFVRYISHDQIPMHERGVRNAPFCLIIEHLKSDEILTYGRRIVPKIVFDFWTDRCVYLKSRATFVRPFGRTALYLENGVL